MRTVVYFFLIFLVTCLPFRLYSQSGTLDMTFDGDGIGLYSPGQGHDNCNDMLILPDNKILVAGVTKLNGEFGPYSGMLLRILENGSIDPTWGNNGLVSFMYGTDTYLNCVALQPDGKILVAGNVTNSAMENDMFVGRFNANGTPDLTFNVTGYIVLPYSPDDEYGYAMALQPDGKVVVAGGIFFGASTLLFARINANGTLDTGFGTGGYRSVNSTSSVEFINTLGILSNGTIVGMGYASQDAPDFLDQAIMVKLTANGTPMPGFGTNGVLVPSVFDNTTSIVNDLHVNNNMIFATGEFTPQASPRALFITKLDTNGVAVPTFGNAGIHLTNINTSNNGYDVRVFSDNKIYVTGLTGPAGFGNNNIITLRYTENGLPDLSWNGTGYNITDVRPDGDAGYAIDIQSNGKVVVAGTSNGMSTTGRNAVAVLRYQNDVDPIFGSIQGQVSLNGGPGNITQVVVTAGSEATYPDASGFYIFNSIQVGTYNVSASIAGYYPAVVNNVVVIENQATLGVDFLLEPVPTTGFIEGQVILNGGSGDVTQTLITAGSHSTHPDSGGFYNLETEVGIWDVEATLTGYTPLIRSGINVTPGGTTPDIDFTLSLLPTTGYLQGNVTLEGGMADITLASITAGSITVHPAANGFYFMEITAGTYTVTASHPYTDTQSLDNIAVEPGLSTTGVNFTLNITRTDLVCKATDQFGGVLYDAEIEVTGPEGTYSGTITGDSLVFENIPYGLYEGAGTLYGSLPVYSDTLVDGGNHHLIFVFIVGASGHLDNDLNIVVRPNPVTPESRIIFESKQVTRLSAELLGADGKRIGEPMVTQVGKGTNEWPFDILTKEKHLSPGLYLLVFNMNNAIITRKILISKQ